MNNRTALSIAERIAWRLYGVPYRWGGDNPGEGFDCSGFVIEILKSANKLPTGRLADWTAKGLFKKFKHKLVKLPKKGCLVFWGTAADKVYHVEFCLNGVVSIGASGGGSKTLTEADAIKQDAYIKVRKMRGRGAIFAFVNPF